MVGILETSQFYCLGSNMPHCPDPPPKFAGLLRSSRYIRGAGSSWPQICQYFCRSQINIQSGLASPQLPFLHVLLERIERRLEIYFNFSIGPPRDLHHHVVHTLACTGKEFVAKIQHSRDQILLDNIGMSCIGETTFPEPSLKNSRYSREFLEPRSTEE